MKHVKPIIISAVSVFLIVLILIVIILRYPLNLIVDSVLLSIVGIASLAYVMIWAFQRDKVVLSGGHVSIYTRVFPTMIQRERTLYPHFMQYFYLHDSGTGIVMKDGEIVNIDSPVDDMDRPIEDIALSLKGLKVKQLSLEEHLKKTRRSRKSYLSRI